MPNILAYMQFFFNYFTKNYLPFWNVLLLCE